MNRLLASSLLGACAFASGCASLPREHGRVEVADWVQARTGSSPSTQPGLGSASDLDAEVSALLSSPVTNESAVRVAYLRNPRLLAKYAELGIARAEVLEAGRISNPTFSYSHLEERGSQALSIEAAVTQSFVDLLLLPSRKRLAQGEFLRVQQVIAGELVELASEVESAWYEYVAARQVAAMRGAACVAAEASAELAQRYFDAGNITRLQLGQEQAALAQSRLEVLRADAAAVRARSKLNALMGLFGSQATWSASDRLAEPVAAEDALDELQALARSRRLDLAAARQEMELRRSSVALTRRWRWLGDFELGYSRESEPGDASRRGPTASLQVPIFNQAQGAIARGDAQFDASDARLRELELALDNDVALGVDRVAASRAIAQQYRAAVVPLRAGIVARTQERVNYMLVGAFELILAKQQEFDAYQGYLEAVRDYWLARVDLARATGGRLPSDVKPSADTIGPSDIIAPPPEPDPHEGMRMGSGEHSMPGHGGHGAPAGSSKPAGPVDEATPAHPTHDGTVAPPTESERAPRKQEKPEEHDHQGDHR